jgi:hypothetical protein
MTKDFIPPNPKVPKEPRPEGPSPMRLEKRDISYRALFPKKLKWRPR